MNLVPDDTARAAAIQSCWSCKGPVAMRALFCSTCSAVQGPGAVDHFSRLGLRATFDIEMEDLERQYFGFQRRLHPDRFATRGARERALSQQQATSLNEAYETLKDPLRRAAYLLRLMGRELDIDKAATIDDPALLMEAMETREALAEADTAERAAAIAAKAESDVIACQCAISAAFAADGLDRAAHLTTRLKYLTKLAEEARARKARLGRRG